MRRYRIFDVRRGLLADDKEIEAESPIEAVRMFYRNVKRVSQRQEKAGYRADIVVNNTYCYSGDFRNDNQTGR